MSEGRGDPAGVRRLAQVSAAFSVAVALLLVLNHLRLREADPLDSERARRLDELAALHVADPQNSEIKAEMLRLDRALRQEYFDHLAVPRAGAVLLLAGVATFVLALRALHAAPRPALPDGMPPARPAARFAVAMVVLGGGAGALVLVLLDALAPVTRSLASAPKAVAAARDDEAVDSPAGTAAAPTASVTGSDDDFWGDDSAPASVSSIDATAQAAANAVPPASVEGAPADAEPLLHWPAARGDGSGISLLTHLPEQWSEDGGGVAWQVPLALTGNSAPVVADGRAFVSGMAGGRHGLAAYDVQTGAELWTAVLPGDAVSGGDHSPATPVTDGHAVGIACRCGAVAALSVATGKVLWSHRLLVNKAEGQEEQAAEALEHSSASSAVVLIQKGMLLASFDVSAGSLYALDVATGAIQWMRSLLDRPALWLLPAGGGNDAETVLAAGGNALVLFDGSGRVLRSGRLPAGALACAPVVGDGRIYTLGDRGVVALRMDAFGEAGGDGVLWHRDGLPVVDAPAGLLVRDGLLYLHGDSTLVCLDAATGDVVYEQTLPPVAPQLAPALAGGRLLLFCGRETVAVEPGRAFRESFRCLSAEAPVAGPAFAPERILLRTEKHLVGIGVP